MKYEHEVYYLNGGRAGKFLGIFTGKVRFRAWLMECLSQNNKDICFRLKSWKSGLYLVPCLSTDRKGKLGIKFMIIDETKTTEGKLNATFDQELL